MPVIPVKFSNLTNPPAVHERQAGSSTGLAAVDSPYLAFNGVLPRLVRPMVWPSAFLTEPGGIAASPGPQILKRQRRVWLVSEKFFNSGIFNAWGTK